MYKFQRLMVYQMALDYTDQVYALSNRLPESERFNLRCQLERAATSVVLSIAEGSTGQSDPDRSFLETIARWDLVERRSYLSEVYKLATGGRPSHRSPVSCP